jgi:hypothetical protein
LLIDEREECGAWKRFGEPLGYSENIPSYGGYEKLKEDEGNELLPWSKDDGGSSWGMAGRALPSIFDGSARNKLSSWGASARRFVPIRLSGESGLPLTWWRPPIAANMPSLETV